jgi:5-methylcytosine-specific restriction endonuclease McrA
MSIFGLHKNKQEEKHPLKSDNYRKTGLNTNPSNYGWYTCVHCGRKFRKGSIDIDHILPQSKGGTDDALNLQCLCIHCNRSKQDKTSQTEEDLKRRKSSYAEYKRSEVLKPKLTQERKKVNELKHQLSDDDLTTMMNKAQKKKDSVLLHELEKEAKRREKRIKK